MLNNNYYDDLITLSNGSWIGKKDSHYDFGYKDKVIIPSCSNFSYISGKLVVLKKGDKITVFSMHIVKENGVETVEKILEFSSFSKVAYGKIICEYYTYLIDGNCQIKFSEKNHIN